ncbi:vegetative cell wall protein gp1-like [Triticum urartu]|uniref:vegetative cell wall protein gp1-like n=1 Tax=Triticum urartu TaxID=4572 RepID=UPI00204360D3|nr:vegetative cell wall protein gp1-like [Triticum urartu]
MPFDTPPPSPPPQPRPAAELRRRSCAHHPRQPPRAPLPRALPSPRERPSSLPRARTCAHHHPLCPRPHPRVHCGRPPLLSSRHRAPMRLLLLAQLQAPRLYSHALSWPSPARRLAVRPRRPSPALPPPSCPLLPRPAPASARPCPRRPLSRLTSPRPRSSRPRLPLPRRPDRASPLMHAAARARCRIRVLLVPPPTVASPVGRPLLLPWPRPPEHR